MKELQSLLDHLCKSMVVSMFLLVQPLNMLCIQPVTLRNVPAFPMLHTEISGGLRRKDILSVPLAEEVSLLTVEDMLTISALQADSWVVPLAIPLLDKHVNRVDQSHLGYVINEGLWLKARMRLKSEAVGSDSGSDADENSSCQNGFEFAVSPTEYQICCVIYLYLSHGLRVSCLDLWHPSHPFKLFYHI